MSGLLITNDFPPMAGGEAAYYARICGAVSSDRVIVLAPRLPGDQAYDRTQPYPIIRVRVPIHPHPAARLLQMSMMFTHAARILRVTDVRVAHIGHLYLAPVALALRRLHGVPYVLYLHGGELAEYMRSAMVRAVVRRAIGGARLVVVNSAFTQRHYEAIGIGLRDVRLLTMSVDTRRFHPDLDPREVRNRYSLNGQRVILTVGRLVERKGHDMVLRALRETCRRVGAVRYVIAGAGPEEQRLRLLARALGIEDLVHFIGHVPDDQIPSLYAACDVFAMPSRALPRRDGVEGFGIAYVEAGACGKPVIGGNSGGINEAVLDHTTGLLVDPSDEAALIDALVRVLSDPAQAARFGAAGRAHAERLEATWRSTVTSIWTEAQRGRGSA